MPRTIDRPTNQKDDGWRIRERETRDDKGNVKIEKYRDGWLGEKSLGTTYIKNS